MTAAAGLLVDAAKSNQTGGMEHEATGARAPTAVNARLQIYHGQLTSVLTPAASGATKQLSLFRIP